MTWKSAILHLVSLSYTSYVRRLDVIDTDIVALELLTYMYMHRIHEYRLHNYVDLYQHHVLFLSTETDSKLLRPGALFSVGSWFRVYLTGRTTS